MVQFKNDLNKIVTDNLTMIGCENDMQGYIDLGDKGMLMTLSW